MLLIIHDNSTLAKLSSKPSENQSTFDTDPIFRFYSNSNS